MSEEEIQLKQEKISSQLIIRGDIVLHEGDLWQCASQNMLLFIHLDSRIQKQIKIDHYIRINRLELIPKEWKTDKSLVFLKGQELGLGPLHQIEIIGMRQFEELQIVKNQLEKGKKQDYKIILCETMKPKIYLIVGVELLV